MLGTGFRGTLYLKQCLISFMGTHRGVLGHVADLGDIGDIGFCGFGFRVLGFEVYRV